MTVGLPGEQGFDGFDRSDLRLRRLHRRRGRRLRRRERKRASGAGAGFRNERRRSSGRTGSTLGAAFGFGFGFGPFAPRRSSSTSSGRTALTFFGAGAAVPLPSPRTSSAESFGRAFVRAFGSAGDRGLHGWSRFALLGSPSAPKRGPASTVPASSGTASSSACGSGSDRCRLFGRHRLQVGRRRRHPFDDRGDHLRRRLLQGLGDGRRTLRQHGRLRGLALGLRQAVPLSRLLGGSGDELFARSLRARLRLLLHGRFGRFLDGDRLGRLERDDDLFRTRLDERDGDLDLCGRDRPQRLAEEALESADPVLAAAHPVGFGQDLGLLAGFRAVALLEEDLEELFADPEVPGSPLEPGPELVDGLLDEPVSPEDVRFDEGIVESRISRRGPRQASERRRAARFRLRGCLRLREQRGRPRDLGAPRRNPGAERGMPGA